MYTRLLKTVRLSALGLPLSLGGCGTTSETFDCQPGKGVGCKSISQVNKMVDGGFLAGGREGKTQEVLPFSSAVDIPASLPQTTDVPLSGTMAVQRISEEHLRVWVAPFQDAQGNLHEGSVIHTVLKPGYWRLKANESNGSLSQNLDLEEAD